MTEENEDAARASEPSGASDGAPATPVERAHVVQDLRATVDGIQDDIRRLTAVEAEKERLDPGDPALDRAADTAVELADRIARQARAERQLGRELA